MYNDKLILKIISLEKLLDKLSNKDLILCVSNDGFMHMKHFSGFFESMNKKKAKIIPKRLIDVDKYFDKNTINYYIHFSHKIQDKTDIFIDKSQMMSKKQINITICHSKEKSDYYQIQGEFKNWALKYFDGSKIQSKSINKLHIVK